MLHEEVEQSRLWQRLGEMLQHLACNEVAASTLGRKTEGGLLYHRVAKVRISERIVKRQANKTCLDEHGCCLFSASGST